jgi:hypothetical protein
MPHAVLIDPVTGVTHRQSEIHLVDRTAQVFGNPYLYIGRDYMEEILCRIVTNWMGDDGFLRVFDSYQCAMILIGDTLFCRGKVINKRLENGEHLVDLRIWSETIRGYVASWGMATVSLFSRREA